MKNLFHVNFKQQLYISQELFFHYGIAKYFMKTKKI